MDKRKLRQVMWPLVNGMTSVLRVHSRSSRMTAGLHHPLYTPGPALQTCLVKALSSPVPSRVSKSKHKLVFVSPKSLILHLLPLCASRPGPQTDPGWGA